MSVAYASSGPPAAVGDTVYVRYGLDILEGTVFDRYETGSGARVVVRLATSDDADGEPPTIAVAESDLFRSDQASEIEPPGTWVSAAQFERMVNQALHPLWPRLR